MGFYSLSLLKLLSMFNSRTLVLKLRVYGLPCDLVPFGQMLWGLDLCGGAISVPWVNSMSRRDLRCSRGFLCLSM